MSDLDVDILISVCADGDGMRMRGAQGIECGG